jgi:6-phosphofructokinase 1
MALMLKNLFTIEKLGRARFTSPLKLGTSPGDLLADFVPDEKKIVASILLEEVTSHTMRGEPPPALEKAGPRQHIYFDPAELTVGIVTCGGLCPGLNDVIRGLVMTLHHGYGVSNIMGFKYGYEGLNPRYGHQPVNLVPETVKDIHASGGTMLGTSRGFHDPSIMADMLQRMGIGLFFIIGGDGTLRGALAIHQEINRRGSKIGVVAVPKTIDNDIPLVDRTFGFQTAVELASGALSSAYYEAISAKNGIGLVKLMGRHSGHIAAHAALAMHNANLVLIPEIPFDLEGEMGLFAYIARRFEKGKSTVIVVAEGAGQEHLRDMGTEDASGNKKLSDIGLFLKETIGRRFGEEYQFTLKYIDPSYMIRSHPANANDSIFCAHLAQMAAHAGMSGRTGMAVGRSHAKFTHVPLERLVETSGTIDPEGDLWRSVLESTGQPFLMTGRKFIDDSS